MIPKMFKCLMVVVLSLQLISCGTLLHPERKGQVGGNLDVGIVVLDGIGLLLFLIPGLIAFAVDFSNGTIYMPRTSVNNKDASDAKVKIVKFDPKHYSAAKLERIIHRETGYDFHFNDERVEVVKMKNRDEIQVRLAQFNETVSKLSWLKD